MRKPLAVTMGDPAGIGPEVALKALASPGAADAGPFVLVGSRRVFAETAQRLGLAAGAPCEVLDCTPVEPAGRFGALHADLAEAAARSVEEAAGLALAGRAAGVVTAPLTKEGLHLAKRPYPGHTEMLAALCGTPGAELMLLAGGGLRVALVTTHLALADVPSMITPERIGRRLDALAAGLARDFAIPRPRIGVLALNPHAGEGGRFGSEELKVIAPAIEAARARGVTAAGPLAADTAFRRQLAGEFDALLAMYHDQGLPVLKTLAFEAGVNVTLGLPIVRTSPDHGTAYDIAGRSTASERSMLAALRLAREIADRRESK
ncbi:MAG TPA: 4-hydroxythreonine-4-phosphate dehydrogenase PdxA [Planctomycetota bacterium]|nr:4-hydroxythreonine-4-phosphate dehydrogenase PdxA [Planctomycetota bacterium]